MAAVRSAPARVASLKRWALGVVPVESHQSCCRVRELARKPGVSEDGERYLLDPLWKEDCLAAGPASAGDVL